MMDSQKAKKQPKTKGVVYHYYYKRQRTLNSTQNAGSTNEAKPRVQKHGKWRWLSEIRLCLLQMRLCSSEEINTSVTF